MFTLPTSVGVRYGRSYIWLEAFLGGIESNDFPPIARGRHQGHAQAVGTCLDRALPQAHPSCPLDWAHRSDRVPPSLVTMYSGAGLSNLLAIAYDYDVLGLGPD